MSAITIAGGVYHESCVWPDWNQIYGSGGRAAAAISGHVEKVTLQTYAAVQIAEQFAKNVARTYGFNFTPTSSEQAISFDYFHCLSIPMIKPAPSLIRQNKSLRVSADIVLRFGMMEGSACVEANRCVYDPQSAFMPENFSDNGSEVDRLAIVANRGEIVRLGGNNDPIESARNLIRGGAEVVVMKAGVEGAYVVEGENVSAVLPFQSDRVWTIGSGDVFAAMFSAAWAVHGLLPVDAARFASRAVAEYANTMALPIPLRTVLSDSKLPEIRARPGKTYLAGPFFTLGQRWLVDESLRCLKELGMAVFSPVHDVGHGPAEEVAPADLAALDECDRVFAILDGLDAGTVFEIGHARARGLPVYVLAQAVSDSDLTMVIGSGCKVFDDFATALHHAVWRA
jgi:nucleoside 2-deoxyribosyltransferase